MEAQAAALVVDVKHKFKHRVKVFYEPDLYPDEPWTVNIE